jgi:hypothetical protein
MTNKPELTLHHLDEWMIRWKKYQTESDFNIEKDRQWWRQCHLGIGALMFTTIGFFTASTSTLKRWFGPPHFFDNGIDTAIKSKLLNLGTSMKRYTPMGYGRVVVIGLPVYITFVTLEHLQEGSRLKRYLAQPTVFGEQARRLVKTGKIEEFLAVNIKSSLPESQAGVYAAPDHFSS